MWSDNETGNPMHDGLPEGYDSMLGSLADELERTDPEWCKEVGEALDRFHASVEPPFRKWKPGALRECDWCHGPADTLYDIPDAAPTGEVDSVCRRCAQTADPRNRVEADKAMNRLTL